MSVGERTNLTKKQCLNEDKRVEVLERTDVVPRDPSKRVDGEAPFGWKELRKGLGCKIRHLVPRPQVNCFIASLTFVDIWNCLEINIKFWGHIIIGRPARIICVWRWCYYLTSHISPFHMKVSESQQSCINDKLIFRAPSLAWVFHGPALMFWIAQKNWRHNKELNLNNIANRYKTQDGRKSNREKKKRCIPL